MMADTANLKYNTENNEISKLYNSHENLDDVL